MLSLDVQINAPDCDLRRIFYLCKEDMIYCVPFLIQPHTFSNLTDIILHV